MTTTNPTDLSAFTWQRQPEAEQLIRELCQRAFDKIPIAATLAERMRTETGTRFHDWIDHIAIAHSPELETRLRATGYRTHSPSPVTECPDSWWNMEFNHPGGVFPPILLTASGPGFWSPFTFALKVDSLADFAAIHQPLNDIEGDPMSSYRMLPFWHGREAQLEVIERHATRAYHTEPANPTHAILRLHHLEQFRSRRRNLDDDKLGFEFEIVESLIDSAIEDIGQNWACDLFFTAEREYWQRRNRAAQFQKARQDKLGLGWANHDHHTYRSSRKHFPQLVALWEKLGFTLRERFYAGAQAGWGAQICEHPVCGIVTFNDVDLSPDELTTDFSHEPLPDRHHLGTVGLWCALHGESILQAGMHHLECQFDFDALKQQLEADAGIKVMKPFTDFPHLRQAFTEGERWPVKPERIDALLAANQITPEQAQTFRTSGAIGSHLENLERNEGFKGFNQTGVSDIIARTDPRLHNRPS